MIQLASVARLNGTPWEFIGFTVDIYYFSPGRGKAKFMADEFFPNTFHLRPAGWTVSLLFRKYSGSVVKTKI